MKRLSVHLDGLIFGLHPHGGISRVFTELLRVWTAQADVDVHTVLPPGAPAPLTPLRTSRLPARPALRPSRLWRPLIDRWHTRATRQWWSSLTTGVFVSSFYSSPPGLRIPQVQFIQDMIYERLPHLFLSARRQEHVRDKERAIRQADAILCPSEHAAAEVRHFSGGIQVPLRVVPYAVSPAFLQAPPQPAVQDLRNRLANGRDYVLFAGARGMHKNFGGLLSAWSRWTERSSFVLLAVGGGPATAPEAALVESLGLTGQVIFAPSLSEEELVMAFHGSRAVVVPSLLEGYGFPVIEALAAGRPVASSTGGSLPEVGADVPYYFDPRDGEALCAALSAAVATPDGHPRLRRGRDLAAARTWDQVGHEVVSFLQETFCR